jgi:hypothetical protein
MTINILEEQVIFLDEMIGCNWFTEIQTFLKSWGIESGQFSILARGLCFVFSFLHFE